MESIWSKTGANFVEIYCSIGFAIGAGSFYVWVNGPAGSASFSEGQRVMLNSKRMTSLITV